MKRNRTLFQKISPTYFVTTTVTEHTNIFHIPAIAEILIQNIRFYLQKQHVSMQGFVIMPNHIHLLCTVSNSTTISKFIGRIKEFSAKQIIQYCKYQQNIKLLQIFKNSAKKYKQPYQYQVWQERFDDLCITQEKTFYIKLNYIHTNPLQPHWNLAQTPEAYKLSSAAFYILGEQVILPITQLENTL